jgi:cytochrome c-type biogenesis protein CcmH/NrfG
MADESSTETPLRPLLLAMPVYMMATICLVAGLAIGYLMRGSQAIHPAQAAARIVPTAAGVSPHHGGHPPTLEEMKQLADRQAAPLLEKLKTNPNDGALLMQVGAIYHTTHRFKEAAAYYSQALNSDPKNVALRTKLASSLYRNGDIEGAISQLNRALTYDPKDANAQFDLGMIKLQGKGDPSGALAAWKRLLKTNPQLEPDRKATVMKLMADVMTMMGDQHGIKAVRTSNASQ